MAAVSQFLERRNHMKCAKISIALKGRLEKECDRDDPVTRVMPGVMKVIYAVIDWVSVIDEPFSKLVCEVTQDEDIEKFHKEDKQISDAFELSKRVTFTVSYSGTTHPGTIMIQAKCFRAGKCEPLLKISFFFDPRKEKVIAIQLPERMVIPSGMVRWQVHPQQ